MIDFSAVKQHVSGLHDEVDLAMRYGWCNAQGKFADYHGGCFNGFGNLLYHSGSPPFIYAAFHGDGAPMTFETIKSNKSFNEAMLAYTQPWNKFIGTARSRRWIEFLLSDVSPWRDLHPFIAEKDIDYINQAGFIFKDTGKLPAKLTYNFVMAIRFPWEMTRNYELFLRLWEDMDPCVALYIAVNFMLTEKAESLDGPYEVIYPWSFLEATNLEAVGRFVLGKPGTLDPDKEVQPNVAPLWCLPASETTTKMFTDLLMDKDLRLPKIVGIIHDCLEQQRKAI